MHSLNDMRNLTKKIAVNFMSCLANVTFFHFNDREILLKIFFNFFCRFLHCIVTSRALFDYWRAPTRLFRVILSFDRLRG